MDDMRTVNTSFHKIQATVNAKFIAFGNRLLSVIGLFWFTWFET